MNVTLEQIEKLRERANVTYAEAKETLEKCNGDILEALINLEAQAKVKAQKTEFSDSEAWKSSKSFWETSKRIIKKGNVTKFVIRKGDNKVIDMPVNLLLIITIIMPPLTLGGVLLAMVTGHKVRFNKPDGNGMKINNTLDKISTSVNSVSDQVVTEIKKD